MNNNLRKFSDVVIDMNKIVMVKKSLVLLDNGKWHDVGEEAADSRLSANRAQRFTIRRKKGTTANCRKRQSGDRRFLHL